MVGGGWTGLPPRCPQSSPRARPQGHHCPQMGKPRPRPRSQGQRGDGATPVLSHPPVPRPDTPPQPRPRPGQGAPPSRHPPALRGRGNRDLEGERRASGLRSGAAGRRAGAHPRSPCWRQQGRWASKAATALPGGRPVPASHLPSSTVCSLALALLSRPPSSGAVGRKEGSGARPPGLCRCPAPPGGAASLASPGPTLSDTPTQPLLLTDRALH